MVKHATYTVAVGLVYRAETRSPISGQTLTAYGNSPLDAKRKVDALIFGEAEQRGLTIIRAEPDRIVEEASS